MKTSQKKVPETEERIAESALFSLHNGPLPGMRTQCLPLHSAHSTGLGSSTSSTDTKLFLLMEPAFDIFPDGINLSLQNLLFPQLT